MSHAAATFSWTLNWPEKSVPAAGLQRHAKVVAAWIGQENVRAHDDTEVRIRRLAGLL